ncbi:hypothetical protein LshimejAT787_1500610 [Lyophyllum shimeji]|uniref:Uncharacterized protein n=1 Tax=Lyophyllum shimeji TaxID=47721 RepID=A0A9P3PZ40_LYOSH|nr:hypothetical protein LshimejAT787_1500610 [Lyophyllum shimeji]
MSSLLRQIIIQGSSTTPTIDCIRSISSTTFQNTTVYSKSPTEKQEVITKTAKFAAVSGLDAAGAESVVLPGPFHKGGGGIDVFERVTGVVKDKSGNRLYFYRTTDHTFWDRIHFPRDETSSDWVKEPIYKRITEAEFKAKKLNV